MKRNKITSLIIYSMIIGFNAQWAHGLTDERIEEFKSRVRYNDHQQTKIKFENVAANNTLLIKAVPDLSNCPYLERSWVLSLNSVYAIPPGDEVEKELVYKSGQANVLIDFHFFEQNIEKAEKRIFSYYSGSSSQRIEGQRGPADIGEFSIEKHDKDGSEIFFSEKNICIRIHSSDLQFDIIGLARWIQNQFQKSTWRDISKELPLPIRDSIGKGNTREGKLAQSSPLEPLLGQIGKPIEISVEMPSGKGHQYIFKEDFDINQVRLVFLNDKKTWKITPVKAGPAIFRYIVIESKSLLFYTCEVPIVVEP